MIQIISKAGWQKRLLYQWLRPFKILISILICSTFYSCVSFERIYKRMEKVSVTKTNFNKLTGSYEMFAGLEYNNKRDKKTFLEVPKNLKSSFYKDVTNKAILIDSNAKYSVNIDCTKDRISFVFFKDKIIFDSINIKGKIKKNGFYYLANSKVRYNGIPYLLGGYQQTKVRLGLSSKGELIVNKAYESAGALLFFMWAGEQYNTCYLFEKLE
jgi:hypothetical protein